MTCWRMTRDAAADTNFSRHQTISLLTDRSLRKRFCLQTFDCIVDFGADASAIVTLVAASFRQHPLGFLQRGHPWNHTKDNGETVTRKTTGKRFAEHFYNNEKSIEPALPSRPTPCSLPYTSRVLREGKAAAGKKMGMSRTERKRDRCMTAGRDVTATVSMPRVCDNTSVSTSASSGRIL